MIGGVRIREATAADVAAMADVHTRARSAYYAAGGVAEAQLYDADALARRHEAWAGVIASSVMTVLCAEDTGGRIVGVLDMGPPHDTDVAAATTRQLFQIHVDPDGWGLGTGSALHDAFTERATAGGYTSGVLEVWQANDRARRFYAARGWWHDGLRKPGPDNIDYLRLRLDLG